MHSAPKSIAVLFHERERQADLSGYIVDHLARFWRDDGHDVTYVFGTRRFVPADVILVHVDLSLVPAPYLDFAARYPLALDAFATSASRRSAPTSCGPEIPGQGR